ncbi:MAG: hypothetical protein FWE36_08360, partial [Erysipelotrichales bacterium]|nr:hypothetical protein [Erysipelotrichales bacterium]
ISAWGDRKAAIVSRRVSSITNPVMDWWDGLDNWQKVAVGAGVLAATTLLTILTGGTAAIFLKGATTKAKIAGAANASAWISAGAGGTAGAITGGWDGFADGFALGAISGAITGPAAKAIGLAKVGIKWKFAKHSAKVVGKGGVYFSASVGMQQIFFGNICITKAGITGAFGMIGGFLDPIASNLDFATQIVFMIGLSGTKEGTLIAFNPSGGK